MPNRTLLLRSLSLRRIQTALVVLIRCVSGNEYGGQLQRYVSSIDHLMPFARRHPQSHIFLDRSFLAIMFTNPLARNDVDQFRAIVNVIIRLTTLRQNSVAEREFLYTFFVGCEKYFDMTFVWSRNFNTLLLPSLDCFQVTSFR